MDIVLHSYGMPFNGETVATKSLGGSESAAYYQARELAKRGHRVTVFTSSPDEGVWDGVTYCFAGQPKDGAVLGDRFEFYARSTPHDVLIIQRHPVAFHAQYASKINLWQLHDLALHRTAGMANHGMWQIDAVTCVSDWHKKQVCEVYGFSPEFVRVVPNGVDADLYAPHPAESALVVHAIKHPRKGFHEVGTRHSIEVPERSFLLLYQSRPERGLEHLVRPGGIMDRLRDTNAHLLVCSYDNNTAPMMPYYGLLHRWADALPNVTMLGALTKPQLAALQKSCDLMVYPTEFEEVSPLRGDAVIDMPSGRETIENLWAQDRKDFWVWSWSHAEKRMVLAKANRVIRTRRDAEMVTIRMRPKAGCKAKCETTLTLTPDHEVMLRDGTYVRADQLKPGDSLMPFGRSTGFGRFKRANGEVSKYWYVSRKNLGDRVAEHRYVAEMALGRKLKATEIVDHIDANTSNNDPSNLQVWGSHAEHCADHWQRLGDDEASARKAERAASIHAWHSSLSSEEMTATKRKAALTRWSKQGADVENHVVVAVERAASADAYCMEVDDTHNFVANGIVVHNCISAMEAMHAGLPMLASVVGALPETCELVDAGVVFIPLKDGRADEDLFVDKIRFFADETARAELNVLHFNQLDARKHRTWEKAVDHLEAVIGECMERRKGTTAAVERHCIEHSDIGFLKASPPIPVGNEIEVRTAGEIYKLYDFALSHDAYKAHYAKHQGVYYDDHEDQVIGEDVTGTTRYQGVASLLAQAVSVAGNELRVLDYGCAHGHYMMPLAKMFPECRFVGMDVSERAIAAAVKWAQRDNVTNVELRIGAQEQLRDLATLCPLVYDESSVQFDGNAAVAKKAHRDLFDVVIAGEIVEHVPDWMALLEDLRNVLKPSGLLVVTTPYGRWEWSGTAAFREAREHLHHFERQDIVEICGTNPTQILYAPAGNDRTGRVLGSWVWGVRPDKPFSEPDYARKRTQLCPRETLSACLIVKDGEKTLRKCVESWIDWVDEVVIAVDPKTKDRTREVIAQLEKDFRWKPFTVIDGVAALEEGFDEARNRSIAPACGDWILWVDADEEVRNPWNLWKYLRPSQHDAFGFPQVHYSADPDQVLTTDFPCRLFRNRKGIKFYGVCHEHPEVACGKAIPRSALRHDVKFLHSGYVDEETRRARYMRNLPLLHRDLAKHPERGLTRFLWLRDIAQGLMFEHEQTRGVVVQGQRERAEEGIRFYEQIIEKDPVRMAIDSLRFYSHCVETLGVGFEAEIDYTVGTAAAPDLGCKMHFKGRFFNRDHYTRLMRKIEEEATRHYESKYL